MILQSIGGRAELYKEAGASDKTIQTYKRILALNLDGGEAVQWVEMGLALHAAGYEDEASAAYRLALRLDRRFQTARVNLGGGTSISKAI